MKTSWGYRKRMIKARLKGGGMVIIFALLLGIGGLVTLSPNAQNFARNIPAAVNTFIIGEDPRKLGEVVVVGEQQDNTIRSRTTKNPFAGKERVSLKVGAKKGHYIVESVEPDIKVKAASLQNGQQNGQQEPTVVVEEYTLGLCRKGEGRIPYYLTFADLSGKTAQIKLPVHLLGDPFSLIRLKEGKAVYAVYVPVLYTWKDTYESYLNRLGPPDEDDINTRVLNISLVGPVLPGGRLASVGLGLHSTPQDDWDAYEKEVNKLWGNKKALDINTYLFEFDMLGRKTRQEYIEGTYILPDGQKITGFGNTIPTEANSIIFMRFPATVTGMVTQFVALANSLAKQGALNQSLADPNFLAIPGEVKVEEASDCVGCSIYAKDFQNPKMDKVYRLMAITPFVINIDQQTVPFYMTKAHNRLQGAPLGLTLANPGGWDTGGDSGASGGSGDSGGGIVDQLYTGRPADGSYLFVGVDTYCEGVVEGLPGYLKSCIGVDSLPDSPGDFFNLVKKILRGQDAESDNVFCNIDLENVPEKLRATIGSNSNKVFDFLRLGQLGGTMKTVINLGVPVISSLTLDTPSVVFKQGISHSLVEQYWAQIMQAPSEISSLNYVELFYVLGKVRFKGTNVSDLIDFGAMPNLERLAQMRGINIEELALELKSEVEELRYKYSPVIITSSTLVKLYPRVDPESELAPFFTKELGPYPVRLYTFLGHDLSWLFRTAMFSAAPVESRCKELFNVSASDDQGIQNTLRSVQADQEPQVGCEQDYISPAVSLMLSTLAMDYNYSFGQIVLKVSRDEQTDKLRLEFEYEDIAPFEVPKRRYDLEKDKELLDKLIPGMVELFNEGRQF